MQLENNNELLNYIKNSDSMAACSQLASQALSQLPLNSGCGNSSKSPIVLSKLLHLPLGLQESYNPPTIVYNALPYSYPSKYNALECRHYVPAKLWEFCKLFGCRDGQGLGFRVYGLGFRV